LIIALTTMTKRSLHTPSYRPSGVTLPLFLRKKWNDQEVEIDKQVNSSNNEKMYDKAKKPVLPLHPQPQQLETEAVFTADDLEQRTHSASVNMIEIQKQLYRGEEMYHEETNSHGNLFIRWDAFIDIRDLSGSSNAQGTGSRRMPADNRWFSGSCKSVSRSSRTYPIFVKGIAAPPTPVPRSQTSTPLMPLPPIPKVVPVPAPIPATSSTVSSSMNPSPVAAESLPIASPTVTVLNAPTPVNAPPVSPPGAIPATLPKPVPPVPTVVVPTKPDATATSKPAITQAPVASTPCIQSEPEVPTTTTETPLRRNRKRKVDT
jgi:hypothetical protein